MAGLRASKRLHLFNLHTAPGYSNTFFPHRQTTYDDNSAAEGAVGYDHAPNYENIYETPGASNAENIYETVEDVRQQDNPLYVLNDMPGCSTYGRIGNAYGRIDILGHGIGRIERHLSSSCGSIDSNHYAMEGLYGTSDSTGRISKVSVQWLLVNKWLPLWIANTETGRDYRIIDFLLGHREEPPETGGRDDGGDRGEGESRPHSPG